MFAIALIIRLLIAPFLTYPSDIVHWAVTVQNFESGNGLYGINGYYYTPVWGYILGATSAVQSMFLNLDFYGMRFTDMLPVEQLKNMYQYADITDIEFNFLFKLPLIVFDITIGYIVYRVIKKDANTENKACVAAALWLFCPLVIYMSAVQCQFDCISAMLFLLSLLLLRYDRCFLSGTLFALSVMLKLFPAICFPLFIMYIFSKHRGDGIAFKKILYAVGGGLITVFVVFLPPLLCGTIYDSFSFVLSRAMTADVLDVTMDILAIIFALAVMLFFVDRMKRTPKENADRVLLPFALATTAAGVIIGGGPQYCIAFIPLLAYYVAVHDRFYLACWVLIAIGGVGNALTMNNFSLLSAAYEYGGLGNGTTLTALMGVMDTCVLNWPLISWLSATFNLVEQIGAASVSVFLIQDAMGRNKFDWKSIIRDITDFANHKTEETSSDET